MRESDKGAKGDHRIVSDPIAERKDFIKHVEENAEKAGAKDAKGKVSAQDNKMNKK